MGLMRTFRCKGVADEDIDDIFLSITNVFIRNRPMTNVRVRMLVIQF